LNASGYVVAQRKAAVAPKITSQLVHLAVEEGSRVKADQLIARLENQDARAALDRTRAELELARHNLDQARAEFENALQDYERSRRLIVPGYITQAEYDAAVARMKTARAAVAAREAALRAARAARDEAAVAVGYAEIRAPFDGVVLTKNADVGDILTPLGAAANAKAAVVTLADMNSLQVEADVSESSIGQVNVGQPCVIQLDALPDARFSGRVHMIVPTADRTKASVMVKVAFLEPDPRILPEMSAKVAFLSREVGADEEQPVLSIPRSALVTEGERSAAFRIRGDRVEAVPVRVGRFLGSAVEVRVGLEAGDKVVVDPPASLRSGSKVKSSEG
jgi:RND family efflux transporter MFP subunit